MPHVDIELEDNKQFISNIPHILRKMDELFANWGDPDQMPHSVTSDLGLYCLLQGRVNK